MFSQKSSIIDAWPDSKYASIPALVKSFEKPHSDRFKKFCVTHKLTSTLQNNSSETPVDKCPNVHT